MTDQELAEVKSRHLAGPMGADPSAELDLARADIAALLNLVADLREQLRDSEEQRRALEVDLWRVRGGSRG